MRNAIRLSPPIISSWGESTCLKTKLYRRADPRLPELTHSPSGQVFDIEAQEFDSFSYLRIYWNIISKRRWTIISAAFIVTLLVAIASFKMTPIYEATVRLDIEADTPQIQSLNDFFRQVPTDEAFIGTQIQVLEGVSLAERTIEHVGTTERIPIGSPPFSTAAAHFHQSPSPHRTTC